MEDTKRQLYLVTGAGGFVGGHLVRLLRSQGLAVRAMVRDAGKAQALQELGAEVVEADLRDAGSLGPAVAGVSGVYHIAAVFRTAAIPDDVYYDINAEGVRRMLQASIAAGVRRFIHCSTIGVLGGVTNPPADENAPYSPCDVYQRSKVEGEKIALEYMRSGRIGGVVIRPAMIYGPGDTRSLKLFKMVAKGSFFYVGRGRAMVHFVDVRDLVRAFQQAMRNEQLNGEVYIIAGQRALPLCDFVELVAARLGVRKPRLHLPLGPVRVAAAVCESICTPLGIEPPIFRRRVEFFTKCRHFNTSKAERDLQFRPAATLEEEISDIVDWYDAHGWLPKRAA